MILILEENSPQSLSDFHADYLKSALSDLKCVRFQVEWLVPCVEKALELHKTNATMKEQRSNLLNKIAKLDEELTKLSSMDFHLPF